MFSKYVVKAYYKQPNKHLLKVNVNVTVKVSKTTLKYIEYISNSSFGFLQRN